MRSFPIFLELEGQTVILLGTGEAADAKRRLYARAGAVFTDDENADARIAVVALEDDAEAEAAVARLKARGLLVNAVDRPHLCDYTTPAIVDRNPVTIAIGTGGASAGLAKALRQRLESLLPQSLGQLAQALANARNAMKARWPDGLTRRRAIDAALGEGGVLDPFSANASDAVEVWLQQGEEGGSGGHHEIRLASQDPDDLSIGQARLLAGADLVLLHGDIAPEIVARVRADAMVIEADSGQPALGEDALIIALYAPD
ncbi:precorrin-2 dehydrogenase/sirohydrochlorin ferrochelatase family protein [Alterisphingorhabdus coralli]|uniref:precorrin-2 dehydrogenase n=1 Tax=Alterisphingorhabdus coralli TaxID=3071408 RepID=A0AA97I1M8_9SPHN|nr:bifunctional precorrin-2 dehydrogenase/sirohydrochlorin ferrochelatase [Parasphingorhabdus sp. SCSIO 66989]WOE76217.1 bifunctional precorrin-2 dehydrogenase/sirohydrochlorin ferrochelatase [Parasphingorhabdus sp. SCSIO 66989]